MHADLAKDLLVDSEGEVQDVSDVVVFHPLQGLVELLVQILQIRQVCWPEEHTELTYTTHGTKQCQCANQLACAVSYHTKDPTETRIQK